MRKIILKSNIVLNQRLMVFQHHFSIKMENLLLVYQGDGKEGEDITENLKTIKDIHLIKVKNFPEQIDIRGEVYIQNSDFEKLSDKFANPRNGIGIIKTKNPKEQKIPLRFIAYTHGFEKYANHFSK